MLKLVLIKEKIYATIKYYGNAIIRLWFSGFHRRYNHTIIHKHGVFDMRGLHAIGTFPIELEQVYVELDINWSLFPQSAYVYAKQLNGNYPIWDFLRLGLRHKNDNLVLVILGKPGSGKTTLLQHIALTFAANKQNQYYLPHYKPILLFLPNHIQEIIGDETCVRDTCVRDTTTKEQQTYLHELVHEYYSNAKNYPDLKPSSQWFARQLKKGKCIVLLDGLDEIADLKQRQMVSDWINQQINYYPKCNFIITARPAGYINAPLKRANIVEIQAFNATQMRQLIHAWYLANEVYAGKVDKGGRTKQKAKVLLQSLPKLSSIADTHLNTLTTNPLLLTMIAIVHRHSGQLPEQPVQLYAATCDILLSNWINIESLTTYEKRMVLQELAAQMMLKKIRDISTDEAKRIITEALKNFGLKSEAIKQFNLKKIQDNTGLLIEHEMGRWRFAHFTFQEYLAAAYFSNLEQKQQLNWNQWVNDNWWYETLCFFLCIASQSNVTAIVQTCLTKESVPAFRLAGYCIEKVHTCKKLNTLEYSQIENRIIDGLESSDPHIRICAAEIKINQRLKNLQTIDKQRDIDLNYITCAEYQLFMDESRLLDKYHQPDHWKNNTFINGISLRPICGIRAEDAEAFCAWLTKRQGITYRLPQLAEAKAYPAAADTNQLATWCKLNHKKKYVYGLTWLTKADEQAIYTKLKNLSDLPLSSGYALANAEVIENAIAKLLNKIHVHEALSLALDLELNPKIFSDLDLTISHELVYARTNANANTRARARAIAVAGVIALALAFNIDLSKTTGQNYTQANTQQILGALLHDLLACVTATNFPNLRQAWRKYTALLTEIIWIGYNKLEKQQHKRSWLQPWLQNGSNFVSATHTQEKKFILNFHWWLRVVIAREEGQLPAWEGIRIVREVKSEK